VVLLVGVQIVVPSVEVRVGVLLAEEQVVVPSVETLLAEVQERVPALVAGQPA